MTPRKQVPLFDDRVQEVELRGDAIRLGQLLKAAGVVASGAEAKALLAEGQVTVDGEPETRRGRQLRQGAVVDAAGRRIRTV